MRVRGSCEPARGLTTTGQAAPNGPNGGEYENTYLVEAEVDLSRVGAIRLMANPASAPEAGGACHLMNTAAYSD
jgi:hypothetical protein